MYVLALKKGWIFGEPFEAHPVEGTEPFVAESPAAASEQDRMEAAQFFLQLVGKTADENPPAPAGLDRSGPMLYGRRAGVR
jgi:hypothetical protein